MNKKTILTVIVLLMGAALFAAQQLSVDYLDGTVELKTAKGWSALTIGDQVASDATIRVSKGGSVEMSAGAQHISILKDGTYALTSLLSTAQTAGRTGIGVSLAQKLRAVTTEQKKTGAVGGVRGSNEGTPADDVQWVEEGDSVKESSDLIAKGRYNDAIVMLDDAVKTSSGVEKQELSYLLSLAYYGADKTALAYRTISKVSLGASSDYYPDFMILKAEILLDSFSFKESQTVVNAFMATKPAVKYAQIAYLISGQCSKGLGDDVAAKTALNAGYTLDPQSETAKTISDILNGQ